VLFSRPGPADELGTHFDEAGRLRVDTLVGLLPDLNADYYVCGPVGFMADIVSGLLARDVPEDRLHYEFFGAAGSLLGDNVEDGAGSEAVDAAGRPILVTFARSGITVPWREGTFSLLALAERAGLRPDASCRSGLCNTCVCRLDDGEVEYAIEPMDVVTSGKVAVCCARPRTSVMVDL
jgi:ferredoxin